MPSLRTLYGDRPLHLVVLLGMLVVAGYAASRVADQLPVALRIAVWFVGAAVAWDLVLAPALAGADRVLRAVPGRVSPLNYLRVPLALSALLLLVHAPVIFQRSEGPYGAASGLDQDPYLERWLLVSALLLVGSAVAYALAVVRARR